jgi:hypothetical protein
MDECGDHFQLYYASVLGQTAEIRTCKYQAARVPMSVGVEHRPGCYNQDTPKADQYGAVLNERGAP